MLGWKPGHVCWMEAAACPNRPDNSDDQELRALRYAAEQVSTDAANVSQLAGSLVPGPSTIFHTQSSLPISTPSQPRFLFPALGPFYKTSPPSESHSDPLIWLLSSHPSNHISDSSSHGLGSSSDLPEDAGETRFLLLVLVHDPFPLLTIATRY